MKLQDWIVLLALAGVVFYAEARWIKIGQRIGA